MTKTALDDLERNFLSAIVSTHRRAKKYWRDLCLAAMYSMTAWSCAV